MLATKHAETGAGATAGKTSGVVPPYDLAAATTEMMWVCALATARITAASTVRGLAIWSQMLCPPAGLAGQDTAPPSPSAAVEEVRSECETGATAPAPAEPIAFASYRSSGGHASAQVIVSD
jgi:hypothetical protein